MPVPIDHRNEALSQLNIVYDLIKDYEQIHVQGLKRFFRQIRDQESINARIRKTIRTLLCTILCICETQADRPYSLIKLKVIRDYLKRMIEALKLNNLHDLCILDKEISENTCCWENIQYSFDTMFSEIEQLLYSKEEIESANKCTMSDEELQQRSDYLETLPTDLDD